MTDIDKLKNIMTKLGDAHNILAKTKIPMEDYTPISNLLAEVKIELFKYYNTISKTK